MIAEHKISSITQFLDLLETALRGAPGWVYRGQAQSEWALCPSCGREQYYLQQYVADNRTGASDDLKCFYEWQKEAVAFADVPEDYLECLAYAQHYGLATRLLDWTKNPLVALFFAVEDGVGHDGAVFAYLNFPPWIQSAIDKDALEQINYVALYCPRQFDRRVQAQSGVFTYHPDPKTPLPGGEGNRELGIAGSADRLDLVQFTVPAGEKLEMMRRLSIIGISRKTLFPDLDGLSKFTNWRTKMKQNPHFENKAY